MKLRPSSTPIFAVVLSIALVACSMAASPKGHVHTAAVHPTVPASSASASDNPPPPPDIVDEKLKKKAVDSDSAPSDSELDEEATEDDVELVLGLLPVAKNAEHREASAPKDSAVSGPVKLVTRGGGGGSMSGGGMSGGSVQAATEVRGSIDKEEIRRVVRSHINEVKRCYEQGLTRRPDLEGRVVVKFTIGNTGTVLSATIHETTFSDRPVEQCIVSAALRWVFPKPTGEGTVVISYPFLFKPGNG